MVADSELAIVSDAQLLQDFLAGSDRAFSELYHRHSRRFQEYCNRSIRNSSEAEDIISALWMKVIELRQKPRIINNPGAYFFTIVRNLLYARQREIARMPTTALENEAVIPLSDEALFDNELVASVEEALESLPDKYREVITLQLYSGYKLDEIATLLDKSPDAIYARASRGRIMLRKIVSKRLSNSAKDRNTL